MKKSDKLLVIGYLFFVINLYIAKPTYAYLDPGTLTLVIQMIVAAFVGVFLYIKIFFGKISTLLKKILPTRPKK